MIEFLKQILNVYEHILFMGKIGLCESHITDKGFTNVNYLALRLEFNAAKVNINVECIDFFYLNPLCHVCM